MGRRTLVAIASVILALSPRAYPAVLVKANNTNALSLASSWTNNVVPSSADLAQWDSTVTGANTVGLGASANWSGITVLDPGGLVTINVGNTLALGTGGIDLSSASQTLTLNCGLSLTASQSWNVASGQALSLGGAVSSGAGYAVTKGGPGNLTLTAANSFSGSSLGIQGGTVILNNNSGAALAGLSGGVTVTDGAMLSVLQPSGSTVTFANVPLTIAGSGNGSFSGALYFNNAGNATATWPGALTLADDATIHTWGVAQNITLAGPITGSGALTLAGRGGSSVSHTSTYRLNATSTYSGNTTLQNNDGLLEVKAMLGVNNALPPGAVLTLSQAGGGQYVTLDLNGHSQQLAGLAAAGGGSRRIINSGAPATLVISNAVACTFPGTLGASGANNFALVKSGPGMLTLAGTNTYSGATSLTDGTLALSGLLTGTAGLNLGSNATLLLSLGAPGAATNILVNGDLTLSGQLGVLDAGGVVAGNSYVAFYYSGSLNTNGWKAWPMSDWTFTLDASTPHLVKIIPQQPAPFIQILEGDLAVSSLTTNLTVWLHGATTNALWYEVRSNSLTGALMDFGAHLQDNPWPFTVRHLRGGTNYVIVYAMKDGQVVSNSVRLTLALGTNTPVRPRPIPAEIWWGGLSTNWPMTNFAQWPFVQQYQDGYFFHSAGWDVTSKGPLMQQLAANLRKNNTKYWPELGGNCSNPSTTWYQAQLSGWAGWATACQSKGIIWSEFTHDYHMENMKPVCQVNPTWPANDQIAWWTGDLTRAGSSYPYDTGMWRDVFNGYYARFPHIKVGHTSQPEYWPWDSYPAEVVNQLAFTVTNATGGAVPFSFNAHDIVGSFMNMAGAIGHPYFALQSDSPWDYFGTWGDPNAAAVMRAKIRVYEQYLQSRGGRHTLICNVSNAGSKSGGDDAQDLYYMQSSLNNLFTHQREGGRANRYLFESWYYGIPHAVVPETKTGSYCNLVLNALKYLKGIADTNGSLEQLNLTPPTVNGGFAVLRAQNDGDYQCLPALLALENGVSQVSTRAFTLDGREVTAAMQSPEGWALTNLLQPGAGTNFVLVTTADPGLAAPTNEWLSVEAFWNPQDPLGIVRDRQWVAPTLSPLGFWQSQDIGSVGVSGGVGLSSNVFSIIGSGADIWGTNDAFRFVYSPVSGEASLTARVVAQLNTDPWAKAGVMVRESLAAGSRHALMCVTPGQGMSFQYRTVANQASGNNTSLAGSAPAWVRLTRSGTNLTGYVSADGTDWTQAGTLGLSGLASTLYWGLAVSAHNNTLASAVAMDSVVLGINHAPVFSSISNRTLVAGATLTVPASNSVSDPDLPPQTLTFSLLSAPVGASLDANSGLFTWRPALSQAPLVTQVRLAVKDNGSPQLSATQSFWVTVNSPVPPALGSSGASNSSFLLSISGDAGPDYIVLGSTNLLNWVPLWTNVSATLPFTFSDSDAVNFPRRFYRVRLGP